MASNVLRGATKSCGCMERESRYGRNHSKYAPGDKFGNLTLVKDTGRRAANKSIIWECLCICGNTVRIPAPYLSKGWWTSCGCSDDIVRHHTHQLNGVKISHLTVIDVNESESDRRKKKMWNCVCDCGNRTLVAQANLLNGHTSSCGCGKFKSAREQLIIDELNRMGVNYTFQYRFQDCKNIFPLPFDFMLHDTNTVIEYDGQHHFYPIEHWGGDDAFALRQQNDAIKTAYCKDHNIPLVRLPYTLTDDQIIETIKGIVNP